MEFTYLWMSLYILSLILVVNLTNLISHAFSKDNMVIDPVSRKAHYEVPDPGIFSLHHERKGLRMGTFLSLYSLIIIFSFYGLTIVAFICAIHWWQVIIAFFIANFISNIYSKHLPLRLNSARYYITQVLTPIVLIACFAILINSH